MSGRWSVGLAVFVIAIGVVVVATAQSQPRKAETPDDAVTQRLKNLEQALSVAEQGLARKVDELMLFGRLEDLAVVEKVRYTGPPPRVVKNPTAPGAKNPVIIPAYTFFPKKYRAGHKLPLMVFAHGGVHGNVGSNYVNVLRELLQQGYAVIAPEYRGSSG